MNAAEVEALLSESEFVELRMATTFEPREDWERRYSELLGEKPKKATKPGAAHLVLLSVREPSIYGVVHVHPTGKEGNQRLRVTVELWKRPESAPPKQILERQKKGQTIEWALQLTDSLNVAGRRLLIEANATLVLPRVSSSYFEKLGAAEVGGTRFVGMGVGFGIEAPSPEYEGLVAFQLQHMPSSSTRETLAVLSYQRWNDGLSAIHAEAEQRRSFDYVRQILTTT